ncbi:VOC family protein [Calothrix rhizosoleniae]|uniref:VOC family protein n=1 Tax=Calothrix rhizosoleniae TaxID=888997 RepID=UPI000B49B230|nr:VOC family protein [Calothrix rhizosoleniae]
MSDIFPCTHAIVTIATNNIEEIINFYTQLLQQQPITLITNIYAEFQLPNLRLGIFTPKSTHASEFDHSHHSTISLCLEVSNLEIAIAHLTNLGYAPPGNIITASHGREIYAYDPDGNRLILHQS